MPTYPIEQLDPVGVGPRPTRILIVEDDAEVAEALSIGLSRQGYEALIAENGRSAMALARSERPDLVVLDLGLPDADGLELCETIADDRALAGLPVIILSGRGQADIIRRARSAGCLYFVRKPYDPNALLILVNQAIAASRNGHFG